MTTQPLTSAFADDNGHTISSSFASFEQHSPKKRHEQKRKREQTQNAEAMSSPSPNRPKRLRQDSLKQSDVRSLQASVMGIEDVLSILAAQHSYEGGVNCRVCGKLYKSRVCFIKHIWEHTVYWNMFDGVKNHERVLSIQAAIILCSSLGRKNTGTDLADLQNLLVTAPHSYEKKSERSNGNLRCFKEDVPDSPEKEMSQMSVSSNEGAFGMPPTNVTDDSHSQITSSCIRDLLEKESSYCYQEHNSQLLLASSSSTKMLQGHFPASASSLLSSISVHSESSQSSVSSSSPPLPGLALPPYQQLHPSSVWKRPERPSSTDDFNTSDSTDSVAFVSPLKRKRED